MKLGFLMATLLFSQLSMAQSMREKRIKQEMLDNADSLITKAEESRELLKKEDVVGACAKINEMYDLQYKHTFAIGEHLDMLSGRIHQMSEDSCKQLAYVHRKALLCKQGKDSELIDPKETSKELKGAIKLLKQQRKRISKANTGFANGFSCYYNI